MSKLKKALCAATLVTTTLAAQATTLSPLEIVEQELSQLKESRQALDARRQNAESAMQDIIANQGKLKNTIANAQCNIAAHEVEIEAQRIANIQANLDYIDTTLAECPAGACGSVEALRARELARLEKFTAEHDLLVQTANTCQ